MSARTADWSVLADPDLRADAAALWPDHPWPETVIADELIAELARVGAYDFNTTTEPPF